jgi:hypothetical protein
MLRDEHLVFQPANAYARSVGGLLRHIVNLEEGWIHYGIRRNHASWPKEDADRLKTLAAIRAETDRVHKETMDFLVMVPVEDLNRVGSGAGRRHAEVGMDPVARAGTRNPSSGRALPVPQPARDESSRHRSTNVIRGMPSRSMVTRLDV